MKLRTDADRRRSYRGLAAVAGGMPIWDLHRRLSFPDLPRVVERIVATCLAERRP
jgi:hypothetical protein